MTGCCSFPLYSMISAYDEAVRLLPLKTAASLGEGFENAEEFRLRTGCMPTALISGREVPISDCPVSCADIACVLEKATRASLHTVQQDMARGFISCGFGLRLGVCGTGIISGGSVTGLRDISSVSIRIPHEVRACGGKAAEKLYRSHDNTLIISPPGGGKTTLLRECIRYLSASGVRVSVADERGELAAVYQGRPQFDIGSASDVMSDIPKAEAVMMLLRAMNPQLIVMDEISSPDDCAAIAAASGCGVRVIASAHAASTAELKSRAVYRALIDQGIFTASVIIESSGGVRSYKWEALQ